MKIAHSLSAIALGLTLATQVNAAEFTFAKSIKPNRISIDGQDFIKPLLLLVAELLPVDMILLYSRTCVFKIIVFFLKDEKTCIYFVG